jgi:dTDP-4-amino-4,6-dideoxygalactose transaminase
MRSIARPYEHQHLGARLPDTLDDIPLMRAQLPDADALLPYLRRIDANRWYTNFGPLVRDLEQRLAGHFAGTVQAVSMSSGTAALELALGALELPPGATVLLPALTFVATATAVIRAGYRPLIADVDEANWLLTPELARRVLSTHRVDAVMPVATFGLAQDVEAWDRFAADTDIPVLIDAAGAFGNQPAAKRCHVAFSLHATKALAAGEGGFVVTGDGALAERMRTLSNFGIDLTQNSQVFAPGSNGKLSEYHAAVAHAALDAWPDVSQRRRDVRARYLQSLARQCPDVSVQTGDADGIYPILVVALPSGASARDVQKALTGQGIHTRQWYCPTLDRHPAFADFGGPALDVAHDLSERLLGLPFFIDIAPTQIDRVCRALARLLQEQR